MACAYYVASVKAYGLDNAVLLCPMRDKSEINVGVFNRNLQHLLNPKSEGDFTMKIGDTEFRKGDKIMQMKNTEFIKNGDIGYITDIVYEKKNEDDDADDDSAETEIHVVIDFDGLECRYREEDMMNVGLAYCTTIHKCQGSEYETVIMVVSNMHEVMLRRNLIYTGITRAEKNVAIIGEESALKKAIYNDKTDKRYTLLGDRLHAML
jgi:exodeoxyribonuclease V alpha subunit